MKRGRITLPPWVNSYRREYTGGMIYALDELLSYIQHTEQYLTSARFSLVDRETGPVRAENLKVLVSTYAESLQLLRSRFQSVIDDWNNIGQYEVGSGGEIAPQRYPHDSKGGPND